MTFIKNLVSIVFRKSSIILSLIISIVALLISLKALLISERQNAITDPASAIYYSNVYFDITNRLISLFSIDESDIYEYPLVLEIYNCGMQDLLITDFYITGNNIVTEDSFKLPSLRKYYWIDNSAAYIPTLTQPLRLESNGKILLRTHNSISLEKIEEFILSIKRPLTTYTIFPFNTDSTYYFRELWNDSLGTWEQKKYLKMFNDFLCEVYGSVELKLELQFLNRQELLTSPFKICNNSKKENRLDNICTSGLTQLLLDELIISDVKYTIEKEKIVNKVDKRNFDFTLFLKYIDPTLKKMGYHDFYGNLIPGGVQFLVGNPRTDYNKEFYIKFVQ